MDFHYGGRTGVMCPPPAKFFGPRWRKPTSSELGLRKHSSGKCVGVPYNETIAQVTEGFDPECVLESSTGNHPNSDGCVIGGDQRPTSDVLQGSFVHDVQSSSGLMPVAGATVAVGNDGEIGVAANVCHEPRSEKRKRCPDEVLPRHRSHISSDDGAHIVDQPSDSHTNAVQPPKRSRHRGQPCVNNGARHSSSTTQASATHACSVIEPSSSHANENVVEPQKRSRRRKQSSASDAAHHSPINTQASPSHACSVTEPSGATQPQKRNRCTRQSPTGRANDRSQNITEGSTSYTPESDDDPKFLQLYIYDTRNEVRNRLNPFSNPDLPPLDTEVVQGLIHFLDAHNELVQMFRTARDKCAQADVPEFKIRLYSGEGPRSYELPSSNTLGAIVFDRGPESESNYDVVLEYIDGLVKRISKIHIIHVITVPVDFHLCQPGFHTKLMLRTANPDDEPKRVSMNAFYTYQLHPRHDSYNLLF
ncbi:helitron helicase-like domain-containing protein [Artemisia annua]|uniref:Helitron helicase-like domain-containing protein n=1 Tax=Artemisia annua TaxID=35608 RepID=A0A2U1NGB4_ARTAN|nr:helitron helicase-like domain-containing protein [Artemisia annua]